MAACTPTQLALALQQVGVDLRYAGARSHIAQARYAIVQPSYAIPIAMIGGFVVGLFTNFTQGIALPPVAMAFLVGYGVEIFFPFLDAFLET